MKTPPFWYPVPGDRLAALEGQLLSPFSYAFQAGAYLRKKFAHPYRSRVPVVCVGNVVAGGAGKTPTALALAELLKKQGHKPVFVTRGYGGRGKLTYVDLAIHTTADVGDEALLLAETAPTWAARDRVAAVREAEMHGTVIILDDGLQNPHLTPTSSFLVIDGDAGLGNERIIPAGPLREPLEDALRRVQGVIMTGQGDAQNLRQRIKLPLFRAHLEPQLPKGFPRDSRFVAFAGLGRPEKFFATAASLNLDVVATRSFADHHVYTEDEINSLRLEAEEQGARLLTTAKDAVRLPPDFRAVVVVLPVRLVFEGADAEKILVSLALR